MARPVCTPDPRSEADRCPGSLALHEAQDGRLARIRLPGGRLGSDQLEALARAAALGNGLVEVTSRANLQLRGLPAGVGEELVGILQDAGLLPSPAHDRARNVISSPVAGRHPRARAGTDAIVSAIDGRLCADASLAQLPGRFLFAVDDGSGVALDHVADVALIARDERTYALAIAGLLTADPVRTGCAAATAVASAAAFLAERTQRGVRACRIGELDAGAAAVAHRIGTEIAGPLVDPARRVLPPGRLEQRDRGIAITALAPLGRLDGEDLVRLAAIAPEARFGTRRTLTVGDVDRAAASEVERQLTALGLILESASGWVGLSACAGLGRCPKARLDVRAAAATRAQSRRPGSPAEHWAACERRCGERRDQPIAAAAVQNGVAVRVNGSEQVEPSLDQALAVLS
jgi:sulfite reductase beta subunit-like hemoprotein